MLGLKEFSRWFLISMLALVCLNIFVVPSRAELMNMTGEDWVQNPSNGHCYRQTRGLSWTQAEEQAILWGGHLVTINDREEELWLRSQFGENERFWIGFNDISAEGNWVWISGEPVTYTNWSQWEPNNEGTYGEVEHAAIMNWSYGGAWNDNSIYNHYRGIVETSQPVVTFWDKEDSTREVTGAAADGASEVLIKVICLPPNVVDPSQVVVTIPEDGGKLLGDATIDGCVFKQTWKAPEDFGGNDPNPDRGRRPIDFQISIPELNEKVPEFFLYKPPVVLVHGIWSDARAFNVMSNHLASEYSDYGIYSFSYPDDQHFKDNITLIGNRISRGVEIMRDLGTQDPIVVKKADVVAHSMGGILVNLYAGSADYKHNINRIITIGTPHCGSELANFALYFLCREASEPTRRIFLWLFENILHKSLTAGAVEDMQVGSQAMLEYQKSLPRIPVHSIAVWHKDTFPGWLINQVYILFWRLDHLLNTQRTFFEGADAPDENYEDLYNPLSVEKGLFRGTFISDFVVSLTSQRGGALRPRLAGTPIDHMNETDNEYVCQMVVVALNSPVSSFDQEGFSPPMNYPIPDVNVYNSQEEICGLKSDDHVMEPPANAGGLSITWPYDSASIQAGSSVVVRVSCDKKPYAGVYLASYDCDLKVDYSEPYEFEFTVNDTSIGPMPIVTWTMNEDGSVSYDLVELHIVTTELLEEITTLPSGPLYLQSGEEVILCVDGVYQGGTIRDLTSLTSTHYTSSDPRVVEISSKGVIKARFPGRAVVTIENAGVSANIDIVVKMVKGIQIAGVAINTEWDYEDPDDSNDTEYTFSFEVITDESVENMVIFTLGVDLFEIPKIPEQEIDTPGGYIETGREYDADISAYRWYYEAIFDNPNGLDDYGDGNYTIIVQYNNGHIEQKNVWFGIPDTNEPIPQPTKEPVFTSFANGATLASPVTFTWESCIDPNAKIINVNLDNEDTDEEMNYILNGNTTGFEEPVPLSDGQWEAELSYIVYYQTETIDGIQVFCCKSSQSDYKFAVP